MRDKDISEQSYQLRVNKALLQAAYVLTGKVAGEKPSDYVAGLWESIDAMIKETEERQNILNAEFLKVI